MFETVSVETVVRASVFTNKEESIDHNEVYVLVFMVWLCADVQ